MAKAKTLILGVGNPLRRDDGIGPAVIKLLKASSNMNDVDIMDGGTDGLSLLEQIKLYKKVLIIDAVEMCLIPGEIRLFTPEDAKINIKSDTLSTHGFGLAEVIKLMEQLEIKTELKIIGIQPMDISFGEGLTKELADKPQKIIKLVKENI